MVREVMRLGEQLRRALDREAWHEPSVLELQGGLSAAHAASHPIAGAHSIWELVRHRRSDDELVLRSLPGDRRPLTATDDWPPCPVSTEDNRQQTADELSHLNATLRWAVRELPDERLDEPLVPEVRHSACAQLIGVPQPHLHHAGTIVLLRRVPAATTAACVVMESEIRKPR